jgi:hypothetical protein
MLSPTSLTDDRDDVVIVGLLFEAAFGKIAPLSLPRQQIVRLPENIASILNAVGGRTHLIC